MLFTLVFESSYEVDTSALILFSDDLKAHFKDKTYGSGIDTMIIAFICVNPQFDHFSIIRKPKYSKPGKKGDLYDFGKTLSLDIKLNFEKYTNGSNEDRLKLLASHLEQLTTTYNAKMKSIKEFDLNKFHDDLFFFLHHKQFA
ncbi:MAG TPA: hypothetical protein VK174_10545 [Chitinophagales bacterium]|nr:hypothetical protein [Chitinophagales bacterium]